MTDRPQDKRLNRVIGAILTVAFLGFVFAAFFTMVITHHRELQKSVQMTPERLASLPEGAGPLDRLSARIDGFTATISEIMFLKEDLGYLNSAFQYGLGKRVINIGSQNMIALTDGHLYDLADYRDLRENAREIAALRDTTLSGIPFLFVYEHPTLYREDQLPAGYEALDHSAQMADEALDTLRQSGVRVLDSRRVLPESGIPLDELLMVTDQHWSTLAAITMAGAIAREVDDMTGAGLDPGRVAPDALQSQVHPALFMGKYGQRLGTALVRPDDITEYWPKYPTALTRRTLRGKNEETVSGSWREAMTRFDRLDPEPGKTWNTYAYTYYGQVESYDIMENPDAPDITLMLLKDSYSAPIGRFLSLMARRVVAVDLRRDSRSLEEWVAEYRPDVCVMAYSLQMLRDDEYRFE